MLDEGKAEAAERRECRVQIKIIRLLLFFTSQIVMSLSWDGGWTGIDGTSRRKNISPGGKIKKRMRERRSHF